MITVVRRLAQTRVGGEAFTVRDSLPSLNRRGGIEMPLILNVGVSKKVGLPNYSSLGASCHVECELESALLEHDLDGFHERVQRVYAACRHAVQDELARHQLPAAGNRQDRNGRNGHGRHVVSRQNGVPQARLQQAHARVALGRHEGISVSEVDLEADSIDSPQETFAGTLPDDPSATERQIIFLRHLATQIHDLGIRRLEVLVANRLLTPSQQLTGREASRLIELLKRVRAAGTGLQQFFAGDVT